MTVLMPNVARFPTRVTRYLLRKATRSSIRNEAARLTRESGLDPSYAEEASFWSTELAKLGYHTEAILRLSIPDRMHTCFPDVLDSLIDDVHRRTGQVPKVADVGSGPLSYLAHGAETRRIDLTAIDPLGDVYVKLLRKYRYRIGYPFVASAGEDLTKAFPSATFDIVWMRNAIDHATDPALVLRNLVSILKPSGYLVLGLFSREGTAEHFHGLHRNDIYLDEENRLMIQQAEEGGTILGPPASMAAGLPIEVVQSTGPTPGVKEWIQIVWKKSTATG
jgi:SAM-dependent methyltransferase